MKMSFLPGQLYLDQSDDGIYRITISAYEVFSSRSSRAAIAKFNEIRAETEAKFPARDLTPDEKAAILKAAIGDSLVGHNSLGGRKKRTTAGSTRTFGG